MNKLEALNLYNGLRALKLSGVKLNYAIARNVELLKAEAMAIEASLKPSDEFTKFEAERLALAERHAKKDDTLNPEIRDGRYVIVDVPAFQQDMEGLKDKHQSVIDERTKQLEDYRRLLGEDSEVLLYKVAEHHLPEDIGTAEMLLIYPFIDHVN
jgi:hypothetical protein